MDAKANQLIQQLLRPFKKQRAVAWALSVVWILAIGWLAFIWNLGEIGLVDETEPLFAEAARQMTITGDWITPYFNEETRFDKPPLIYWLMAIAYRLFGVNEFAARLPSALSAIALTAFGFYTLRFFGFPTPGEVPSVNRGVNEDQQDYQQDARLWVSAWIGAAAIALNIQTIVWGRSGVSDMLLSACMGAALLSFFWGYASGDRPSAQRWYMAFYVFSALAVLTKGPVGVVLPVLIIGAFLAYMGNLWQVLQEIRLLRGAAVFLVITLPWYIAVIWQNGQNYIDDFFGYHNFERFTSVVNHHAAPWYFYFLVVLVGFIPWSIYLPAAIARTRFWERQHWQLQPRPAHLTVFALAWFIVIFGFFSIAATKLPSYVLPLLPAAAILIALLWSEQINLRQMSRGVWISSLVQIVFCLLLAGIVVYSPNWIGRDPAMNDFRDLLYESRVLVWGSLIWTSVALLSALLLIRRRGHWLWSVSLVGFVAFFVLVLMPAAVISDSQRQRPLRQLSQTIMRVQAPDEEILMIGFEKPSVVFYSQSPVTYRSNPKRAVEHIREGASETTAQSALMLGHPQEIQEAPLRPRQIQVLDEAGSYQLIRIKIPPRWKR
ncbi:MAG: ArnT family glycosyltransferase, partial [Elainellaceae cyanobacterium]